MSQALKTALIKVYLALGMLLFFHSGNGQCDWTQVDFEGFEYDIECPDLIQPYNIYHPTPWTNGNQHSGASYMYMNFINDLPSGSLVYERFYEVCPGQQYQISNWFQGVNGSFSNLTFNIVDSDGAILDTWSGSSINAVWTNYISNVVMPTTNTMSFQLISDFAPGNNDMAFDDQELLMCITPEFDDGLVSACASTPIDLFDSLTSVTGADGSWTGPSLLTNDHLGTFTPGTNANGVYTYTIQNVAPCPDEVVSITVDILPNPNVDLLASSSTCGTYTLPPITGTDLTGAEAYFNEPDGAGTSYNAGDIIGETATLYIFDGTAPCTDEESFTVTLENPEIDLGPDIELCAGETAVLDASQAGATYEWQDGTTGSTLTVDSPGTYFVSATIGGCEAEDTIEVMVNPLPTVELGADLNLCEDDVLLLDATNENASYLWQNAQETSTYQVTGPGQYHVTVTFDQTGCTESDTINIGELLLPTLNLGVDTTVCQNTRLQLTPAFENTDSLVWYNGSNADQFTAISPTTIYATAYNSCGSAYDELILEHKNCSCNIFVANAFTPDGDGLNEILDPVIYNCDFTSYDFRVFDRWGQIVFETTDPDDTWTGGHPEGVNYYARNDIYSWVMSYSAMVEGELKTDRKMGRVTIVR